MLGFLNLFTRTRTAPSRPTPRRSTRLWLEQLETRDCPSAPGGSLPLPPPAPPGGIIAPTTSPVISLSLTMNGLKSVTLTGSVTADQPAGLTVTFLGALSAVTTTDGNGNFSLTVNADCLGTVQATTVDQLSQMSNTATATVAAVPPEITYFRCRRSGDVVVFVGTVVGRDAFGMVVTVQGAPVPLQQGVTDVADVNGTFAVVTTLTAGQVGAVAASCVDCWGQQSNVVFTYVS